MTKRILRHAAALTIAATLGLTSSDAHAVWPAPVDATREQMADPQNWPNDPDYRRSYHQWSFVPRENQMLPGFRTEEAMLGAGMNIDRAWSLSTGDPRVLIAIMDSGIYWDDDDTQLAVALNTGELPLPQRADGTAFATHDADGDGVVTVADYLTDPRVTCGTTLPHALRDCRGADGMPNDPNGNRVFDAGDLIRVFSDNVDDDNNGYVDDVAGWDFFKDDNDPYDDTRYGHGTGEARDSAARANNMISGAGDCPNCRFIPVRTGDSFLGDVNDYGQGVMYAVDRGARVVQAAFVTLNNNPYGRAALDYAYRNGVLVVNSAGDENARNAHVPGTNNHSLYVHAVAANNNTLESSTSFLAFGNCTNYGGQLMLSVSGDSCSSEAVGHTSGMAGLIHSMGLQSNLSPALSAEEVRQIFLMTTDDINIPESIPGAPNYNRVLYPSRPGWDQRFAYGRVNARRALEWVRDRRIPPEVDITAPVWFEVFNTAQPQGRRLRIEGSIAARRAPTFDYVIEWAPGIEPEPSAFRVVREERNVTAALRDTLGEIDLTGVTIDNPGAVQDRHMITVRVRAIAHYDAPIGDVPGEARRTFHVVNDPDLLPGFPMNQGASGESSPHLVDLNGDGRREIVQITSDGFVHALQADRTELPGWPVHLNLAPGMDPAGTPNYRNARAYTGPDRAIDPDTVYEFAMGAPGVADLDGDRDLEIVVAGYDGTLYVWNHDGTPYGHGFPVRLPPVPSSATGPDRLLDQGMYSSPVLFDLDRDGTREIIVGGFDGYVHVFRSRDGMEQDGFPVLIHNDQSREHNRVWGSVGVGRFDNDDIPDLAVVSNERMMGDENYGAFYVVHGDGNRHAGGPYHPNWPMLYYSFHILPLVGQGVSGSPAIADIDGDGIDELSLAGVLSPIVLAHGTQPAHTPRPMPGEISRVSLLATDRRGILSNSRSSPVSFINAFSIGSFGDMDGDGQIEYSVAGATFSLALAAQGTRRVEYEQLLGAWNARSGQPMPGFPRVIEGYTFFQNPAIADVSGDGYAESLVASSEYYLHAIDACGREAPGFPKLTGQWTAPSPTVGDIDGDGTNDVVINTRSGFLYAWRTRGDARTGSVQWPTYRHDPANTGNFGTPLDQGVLRPPGQTQIQCPAPMRPDAGVDLSDGGGRDAGVADARGGYVGGGGCGCHVAGEGSTTGRGWMAFAALSALSAAVAVRRRRRCSATRS